MNSTKMDLRNQDDDELDVKEILGVLWRRRLLIIGLSIIGIALGGYHAFRIAVPKYSATVSLALQVRNENVLDIKSVISGMSTDISAINTEMEVIRSGALLGRLVSELDLTRDPEFNNLLKEPSRFSLARARVAINNAIKGSGVSPHIENNISDEVIFNNTVSAVRGAIVPKPQKNTYVFKISVISENSKKATLIANTLAKLYIESQIDVKFQATENAILWLSERVVALGAEIKEKESAIKDLRAKINLATPEGLILLNQQARDIRERIINIGKDAALQKSRVTRILNLEESRNYIELSNIFNDPTLDATLDKFRLGGENNEYLLQERLKVLIISETNDLTRLQQQSEALSASLQRLDAQISSQSTGLSQLQQLQRELDTTRTLHETFLTRLKETTVQRGLQQADSRVLSKATRGIYVEPQKTRIILLYAFLGIILGSGVVLVRHFFHDGFRTREQLESTTGRVVLGEIPMIPIKNRKDLISYLNEKPMSAAVEAVRNLRTSVILSNVDKPPQVVMSTSSVPGEGKTTLALALAHNFSGLGKRVLLIDGDTRRRTLANYVESSENVGGLATALTSGKPIENFLVRSENTEFDILMGENSSINAADLFSSEKFEALLTELREKYDFIVIDTPPVLVVPDARIIGQLVDAVVFSVAWDRTAKSQVNEAIRSFETVGVKITGVALAQVDHNSMKGYGYGGKYGNYSSYYSS